MLTGNASAASTGSQNIQGAGEVVQGGKESPAGAEVTLKQPVWQLRGYAEGAEAWLNLGIKFIAVLVVMAFIFWPTYLPIFHRLIVKTLDINIMGSHIHVVDIGTNNDAITITDEGKLLIAGIDASEVPDRIARLEQAVHDVTSENQNLKTNLESLQGQLTETARKETEKQIQNADAVTAQANRMITGTGTALTRFGIVFGGFPNQEAATAEIQGVTDLSVPAAVFHRQNSWRTVALFDKQDVAHNELTEFKKVAPDAYIVDISKWCPLQHIGNINAANGAIVDCGF